jgi:hypothetical protein
VPYPIRVTGETVAQMESPGVPLGSFMGVTYDEITLPLLVNDVFGLNDVLVPYESDSTWNYELGVKTNWFDERALLRQRDRPGGHPRRRRASQRVSAKRRHHGCRLADYGLRKEPPVRRGREGARRNKPADERGSRSPRATALGARGMNSAGNSNSAENSERGDAAQEQPRTSEAKCACRSGAGSRGPRERRRWVRGRSP